MKKLTVTNITKKGRKALKGDRFQGVELLIVEVMSRTSNVDLEHLYDLVEALVAKFQTPEAAVAALRAGTVILKKAPKLP